MTAVALTLAALLALAGPASADIVALDPDTDDVVQTNGSTARVVGTLTCSSDQIGLSYRVRATLTQGSTKATGSTGGGVCSGAPQEFTVTVHVVQGPGLAPGSAQLAVNGQTGTPGVEHSDTTGASETVTVVVV